MFSRILILFCLLGPTFLLGQSIGINNTGTTPDPSAMLDVNASDKGMLVPRMSTAQRIVITSPATGLLVFDTDTAGFWFYNGSVWQDLSTPATDLISDLDLDTKIEVESVTDEDTIRMSVAGVELLKLDNRRMLLDSGDDNIYIGKGVAPNGSLSQNNIVLGPRALKSVISADAIVAIGADVMSHALHTDEVIAIGDSSLHMTGVGINTSTVLGGYNIAIGVKSGFKNTSGYRNMFLGHRSGLDNTSGIENTMVGYLSGAKNIAGYNNSILGAYAGAESTSGRDNTFVGYRSGEDVTSGDYNTIIGSSAGTGYQTGDRSVFLGYQAGFGETDGERLYIESSDNPTPLIYGEFDNDLVRINGKLNINGEFEMGNNYSFPTTSGSDYSLLMSRGAGQQSEWSYLTIPSTPGADGQILKRNSGNAFVWSSDNVNDADSSPSNELQSLSISGNLLTLSSGNSVTIPSDATWNETGSHIYYDSGNVAIGTSVAPTNRFEVKGSAIGGELVDFSSSSLSSNETLLHLNVASGSNNTSQVIEANRGSSELLRLNSNGQLILNDSSPESDYALTVKRIVSSSNGVFVDGDSRFEGETTMVGDTKFRALSGTSHEIGIYPDNAVSGLGQSSLFLSGDDQGGIGYHVRSEGYTFKIINESLSVETERLDIDFSGKWTINEGAFILDPNVSGDSRFITDELEIRGGSDLAEKFDIITNITPRPGMLVSIDRDNSGKLIITKDANDPLLAGVISGANGIDPGMLMGQEGTIADGEYPITLTGRAYVKANHTGGKILPGDLISSSEVLGEAMKANIDKIVHGSILGKALTNIDDAGYVLVLVNVR